MIELPEGVDVCYRPIEPGDAQALQRFRGRLGQRSVYLRFFLGQNRTQRQEGCIIHTAVDVVQVRARGPRPWARRSSLSPASIGKGTWQSTRRRSMTGGRERASPWRHSIGAFLKDGVRTLTGIVLPENARMLNLFRYLGFPEPLRYRSVVERVEIDLLPQRKR